jgi:hypothetical protein
MIERNVSEHRRPGTMYVAVMGCSLIVTVLGVSAVMLTRVETLAAKGTADLAAARSLAQAAVDLGFRTISTDATWRTSKSPGAWRASQAAGDGTVSLSVTDPVDAVFSDANWEPVTLTGTGVIRQARYLLEATAVAQPAPLPALNTCLHTSGKITVSLLKNVTLSGAPLSMNGSINGPGTVTGNVQAGSTGTPPIIVGTSTVPSPAKEMPDAGVFAMYKSMATTITGVSEIDRQVLSATRNPWGTANPDGVYFIDAALDFRIRRSRIQGTLLIKCAAGAKVLLDDTALVESFRADYPTLIIDGPLEIALSSGTISEATDGVNLNPATSPYLGSSDIDTSDSYPNELRGLIHVLGTVTFSRSSTVRGVIIAQGNVSIDAAPQLIHTPALYARPPMGYVTYSSMQMAYGSWRHTVSP